MYIKLPKDPTLRKAYNHLLEAASILCSASSPYGVSLAKQESVNELMFEFIEKLEKI
jgi:hypothetical protein